VKLVSYSKFCATKVVGYNIIVYVLCMVTTRS